MWAGLLALACWLALLAAAGCGWLWLVARLWPAKPGTVWRMDCQGCSWGGDVTGPDDLVQRAVRMLAAGHVEQTGHGVWATDQRR